MHKSLPIIVSLFFALGATFLPFTEAVAGKVHSPVAKKSPSKRVTMVLTKRGDIKRLSLHSAAALVVDEESGRILYAKNVNTVMPIASITKLMTAMVVLDKRLPLEELIAIDGADVDTLRNTGSRLHVGTILSRYELLRLALMSSENRAASALARSYPGGRAEFISAMNTKAWQLGMYSAQFVDPTGLHTENSATALDLVKMVRASYDYDLIREFTTTSRHDVELQDNGRLLAFKNSNTLVAHPGWEIKLSKTGFTSDAGRCLVMQAKIASKPVIIVLLDSLGKLTRIGDANRIKKWIERRQA